jgi:broad specificity phosphatase PhoE
VFATGHDGTVGELVLIRHGETEWSATGRHTSFTDIDLTPDGERHARAIAAALGGRTFVAVYGSPRKRALRTAELAGLQLSNVDEDLVEWNYGEYEGITTDEIHQSRPQWSLWTDGAPGGESPERIQARIDRVLARVEPLLAHGDVALIGHGHALRVVGARWIGLPASGGAKLRLDTATISTLGYEHGRHVILRWNLPAA